MATTKTAKIYARMTYRSGYKTIEQEGHTKAGRYFLRITHPETTASIGFESDLSIAHCRAQLHLVKQEARQYAERQGWVRTALTATTVITQKTQS